MSNFANLKNFTFLHAYFVSDFYIFWDVVPEKGLRFDSYEGKTFTFQKSFIKKCFHS